MGLIGTKRKGLSADPGEIIVFVIGAVIAVTALGYLLGGAVTGDYYNSVAHVSDQYNGTTLSYDTNVSPLFILVAAFVPVGVILAALVYFFKV